MKIFFVCIDKGLIEEAFMVIFFFFEIILCGLVSQDLEVKVNPGIFSLDFENREK
jgi:hypothetical protein